MIELSTIRDLVTIFGVIAGFSYYVLTVRNTQRNQKQTLETRQAQLLMNIMNTFRSTEFRKQWHVLENLEWTDFNDFMEKYHKDVEVMTSWTSIMTFFEGVGVMVKNQLIDISLIYSLMAISIQITWERYETLIMGDRELFKQYSVAWDEFEYLYNEIMKYRKSIESTP